MSSAPFVFSHRVTYAECTLSDHIYHSRYLDLFEAARGEFFRHLGVTFRQYQELDTVFPVVECRLRYKSPARYDDLLRIELWVTRAHGVRLSFGYRILNASGHPLVEAETWHTCATVAGKVKRLPPNLCAALQSFQTPRPAPREA